MSFLMKEWGGVSASARWVAIGRIAVNCVPFDGVAKRLVFGFVTARLRAN